MLYAAGEPISSVSMTVWLRYRLYEGVPGVLCLNLMSLMSLLGLMSPKSLQQIEMQTVLGSCSSYQSQLLYIKPVPAIINTLLFKTDLKRSLLDNCRPKKIKWQLSIFSKNSKAQFLFSSSFYANFMMMVFFFNLYFT